MKQYPRFIFGGDREIAVDLLGFLLGERVRPQALVVPSNGNGSHSDVLSRMADVHEIPVWCAEEFGQAETHERLANLALDFILCVHLPTIIPPEVLRIPKHGVLNLHPAYLPYNRGWHTPSWAILKRAPYGATLHWMAESVDAGDILHQKALDIKPGDTAHTLYQRVLDLEKEVFREAWPMLLDGSFKRIPQDNACATVHKRRDLFRSGIQRIDISERVVAGDLIDRMRALTTNRIEESCYFVADGRQWHIQVVITERSPEDGQG